MPSTNKTPYAGLSQFIAADKPAWLTDYNNDMLQIDTLIQKAVESAVPAGTITSFAGNTAPEGYLLCNGQEVSRTQYAGLFKAIGTTYGGGNGTTTFKLPDLTGRFPLGNNGSLGTTGGEATTALTVEQLPKHRHMPERDVQNGEPASRFMIWHSQSQPSLIGAASAGNNNIRFDWATGYTGGDQPHNNMPPYLRLNFIIKY